MKYRDSGMPAQEYWETLFDVEGILDAFAIGAATGEVVELGCGYGTFTLPVARRTRARVHAFDIDPAMIEATRLRAAQAGLAHIRPVQRDVSRDGYDLPDGSAGACLLFNILHGEQPVAMLREAARVVREGGVVAVIHWRRDIETPRGPGLDIRPDADRIRAWAREAGGLAWETYPVLLPPWHFGLGFRKVLSF